jgi:hypothetical protein
LSSDLNFDGEQQAQLEVSLRRWGKRKAGFEHIRWISVLSLCEDGIMCYMLVKMASCVGEDGIMCWWRWHHVLVKMTSCVGEDGTMCYVLVRMASCAMCWWGWHHVLCVGEDGIMCFILVRMASYSMSWWRWPYVFVRMHIMPIAIVPQQRFSIKWT